MCVCRRHSVCAYRTAHAHHCVALRRDSRSGSASRSPRRRRKGFDVAPVGAATAAAAAPPLVAPPRRQPGPMMGGMMPSHMVRPSTVARVWHAVCACACVCMCALVCEREERVGQGRVGWGGVGWGGVEGVGCRGQPKVCMLTDIPAAAAPPVPPTAFSRALETLRLATRAASLLAVFLPVPQSKMCMPSCRTLSVVLWVIRPSHTCWMCT